MGCIFYLISFPFIFLFYFFKIMIYLAEIIFKMISYVIAFIISVVKVNNKSNCYVNSTGVKCKREFSSYDNPNKNIRKDYKDMQFDKEADLWGLSQEDRRIARQERMSPADYIEAEERDDDNLDIDD